MFKGKPSYKKQGRPRRFSRPSHVAIVAAEARYTELVADLRDSICEIIGADAYNQWLDEKVPDDVGFITLVDMLRAKAAEVNK